MPEFRAVTGAALLAILSPGLAHAAAPPPSSWGKAGVSYDDYLRDSIECGLQGYYLEIAATKQAEALRQASSRLESLDGTAPDPAGQSSIDPLAGAVSHARQLEAVRASAQPDRQIRELRAMMTAAVGQCLTQRGYQRFTLDDAQRAELSKLASGTEQRRHFLHALGSDPQVLAKQTQPSG